MHESALFNAKTFFECYGPAFKAKGRPIKVIDIGAQDVNGSLKSVCPPDFEYVGVDFVAGKGVDVILDDPYALPFADGSVDIVVSSSCFEHSQMFWLLFLEIIRTLKPDGIFYLNVPSNGAFHRYPVDCWRFYPDSGKALEVWAQRSGYDAGMLESYTCFQMKDAWNDFVAVFVKERARAAEFPTRIVNTVTGYTNGFKDGSDELLRYSWIPEDQRQLQVISDVIFKKIRCV